MGCLPYNRVVKFTTIFFDLDDTLYPSSTGLWPALQARIISYMTERMGIAPEKVDDLREKYFREYGTTLQGLQRHHAVDTADYLSYVHDVDLKQYLKPSAAQQAVLAELPTKNIIFTNADKGHAERVLEVLQITQFFSAIVDVTQMHPHCKPSPEAFQLALSVAGESDAGRCVLIDDLPRTTQAAKNSGLYTVLYGSQPAEGQADGSFSGWSELPALLETSV